MINGEISSIPQRKIFSFCDGIIGGQGNGPLSPDPLLMGILEFSNNSFLADTVIGKLWNLNIDKIPLLKAAKEKCDINNCSLTWNGEHISWQDLKQYGFTVTLPPGWVHYDEDKL